MTEKYSAFVCLISEMGLEEKTAQSIRDLKHPGIEVGDIKHVYGVYDTVMKVTGDSMNNIKDYLTRVRKEVKTLKSTLTMPVVDSDLNFERY